MLLQEPAHQAEFMRHHGRSPLTSFATVRRDLIRRQHRCAGTGSGCRTRHAPHHARSFVLGDDAAARLGYGAGAGRAVVAHAGEHDAERGGSECRRDARKERVDRGAAEIHRAARCRYASKALLAARPSYDDCQAPHRSPRASAVSPSLPSRASRPVARASRSASTVVNIGGMCCATSTAHAGERGRKRAEQTAQGLRAAGRAADRDYARRHQGEGAPAERAAFLADFTLRSRGRTWNVGPLAPQAERPPSTLIFSDHLAGGNPAEW